MRSFGSSHSVKLSVAALTPAIQSEALVFHTLTSQSNNNNNIVIIAFGTFFTHYTHPCKLLLYQIALTTVTIGLTSPIATSLIIITTNVSK